nr:hypothetical protein [Tanacetum cinerariifolium]
SVIAYLKFLGLTFDSTELYKHHKASVVDSVELTSSDDDASELDEGVPTELTGACTAGVGETGLLARGGSRRQKNRSGSCTEMHRSHWLNQLVEVNVNGFHDSLDESTVLSFENAVLLRSHRNCLLVENADTFIIVS